MATAARTRGLTDDDLAQLSGELDSGKRPTVWFTSAAVGVHSGQSGKVVGFTEPRQGDFIQVKPTGSSDVLSFSTSELTTTRPGRKPKPGNSDKPRNPVSAGVAISPAPAPVASRRPARRTPKATAVKQTAPTRAPRPVTVTLSSTPEGEWKVDVLTGKKRVVRAQPVSAAVVAQVAKVLSSDVASAVDTALEAARQTQRARVAQLQAELEQARRALDELSGEER